MPLTGTISEGVIKIALEGFEAAKAKLEELQKTAKNLSRPVNVKPTTPIPKTETKLTPLGGKGSLPKSQEPNGSPTKPTKPTKKPPKETPSKPVTLEKPNVTS